MIISPDSHYYYVKKFAGGKAFNLFELNQVVREYVPPWRALSWEFFQAFIDKNQLRSFIDEQIEKIGGRQVDASLMQDLEAISSRVEAKIMDTPFSSEERLAIESILSELPKCYLAVRSSAVDEDSQHFSFAGQLSSFLGIRGVDQVIESIKKCWASAYSSRSLFYRLKNNISLKEIRVSVIVQALIEAEKSGVLFTCDPVNGRVDLMIINSVWGLGEGLVSGALNCDSFVVDKKSETILDKDIALKSQKYVRSQSGSGIEVVMIERELSQKHSLSDEQIKELVHIGKKIEQHYGYPQDIEWCSDGQRFWVVQTRPVTTELKQQEGRVLIWDNSNIIESYGGITLPLTFGFAKYVYHQVYVQFCELLWVPHRYIKEMNIFLRNMLGIHNGHIYYNILNWYKLVSILPGFKHNRQFMETMMGTKHSLTDEIANSLQPFAHYNTFGFKVRQFLVGLKFYYFHLTIDRIVADFMTFFNRYYHKYRKLNYKFMPASEIFQHFLELERSVLANWKAPIINDFLCMVHFGLLKKLCQKWLPEFGESLANELISGGSEIESTEPMREILRLSKIVKENNQLAKLFETESPFKVFESLRINGFVDFLKELENYIERFGYRCMNEMKLEEIDLYQDPIPLIQFIKNALSVKSSELDDFEKKRLEQQKELEKAIGEKLGWVKKWVFRKVLAFARKAVKIRENTRFCRTRIYGVVRAMFYGIGSDLARRKIIDQDRDVFYLSYDELHGIFEGTLPAYNLKDLIEARKKAYAVYQQQESPPSRFITHGIVYWANMREDLNVPLQHFDELGPNQLKGMPCSPGIVEGVSKVILTPQDDLSLSGEILVTLRTDPGWIPLYPSASGLLVERGGLLSHSAVVAREMGLPTIVGIADLTKRIKTGDRLRMNGQTGIVEIINN
ncbi:MAG: phosphoenolpyruvate synthase [Bdellovibrionaceae bacterium]|nr:phosphoenolpyruvate synthase [Pseudobdellovibrionaceae bacterium]MDW8189501.1 phosphoenolpyruvate synthase [Pseudobdellovibrionaceae bacterium]